MSPKISEHMGPSNAITGEGMPEPTHIDGVPVEKSEDVQTQAFTEQDKADAVENPTVEQPAVEPARDYAKMLKADVKEEAERRGLDGSGNKDEIVARLEADDEARKSGASASSQNPTQSAA